MGRKRNEKFNKVISLFHLGPRFMLRPFGISSEYKLLRTLSIFFATFTFKYCCTKKAATSAAVSQILFIQIGWRRVRFRAKKCNNSIILDNCFGLFFFVFLLGCTQHKFHVQNLLCWEAMFLWWALLAKMTCKYSQLCAKQALFHFISCTVLYMSFQKL